MRRSACTLAVAICTMTLLCTGCSGKPSEADAQKIFEHQMETEYQKEFYKLIRFSKTNAQDSEMSGIKVYTVECKAEVEYLKDCMKNAMNKIEADPGSTLTPFGCTRFKKGQHDTLKGLVYFSKTENGWKGTDGNIY